MGQPTLAITVVVGFGALLVAPDANALGPVEVEIAAKGGGGFPPLGGAGDGLGGALGGRAGGLCSSLGLYGGLSFLEYGGGGSSITSAPVSSVPMRLLDRITLRAQLGLGDYVDVEDTQDRARFRRGGPEHARRQAC